jgi:uncharacterized protein
MRLHRPAVFAAIIGLGLAVQPQPVLAVPPSPVAKVATDPAPLPLPPVPGAQSGPGTPPPTTPVPAAAPVAANDPFNPLNSAPVPVPAPAPAAAPAANFDPFAANTPPAPPPSGASPLSVPNTPLTVPPPAISPNPDTVLPVGSGGSNNNFGNLPGNLPPAPDASAPVSAPAPVAEAVGEKPKVKKSKPFKPSFAAGKRAFEKGQFDTAAKNLLPLARRGNTEAQYLMGVLYSHAKGKLRDFQKSAHWYEQAAAKGNAEAQFNLGFLLYQGAGEAGADNSIAVNHAEAAKYLSQAAQQNVPMAQHLLSLLYLRGSGVAMDMNQAFALACRAADAGVFEAMYNCGMMAVRRPGTTMQDYVDAYRWFTILTMRGYPGAAENRALIGRYMPPKAIEYAEALAMQWQPGQANMTAPIPAPNNLVPMLAPPPAFLPPGPQGDAGTNPVMQNMSDRAIRWNFDKGDLSVTRGDKFDTQKQVTARDWVNPTQGNWANGPMQDRWQQPAMPSAMPLAMQPAGNDMPWQNSSPAPSMQPMQPMMPPQHAMPHAMGHMPQPMAQQQPMPQQQQPEPYQSQPIQPILPPNLDWQPQGWTMGDEKLGQPQMAQPMGNPQNWPWSGSNQNSSADQAEKLRQIRAREQYMLSN